MGRAVGFLIPSLCAFLSPPMIHQFMRFQWQGLERALQDHRCDCIQVPCSATPFQSVHFSRAWGLKVPAGQASASPSPWFHSHTGLSDLSGLLRGLLTPRLSSSSFRQINTNINYSGRLSEGGQIVHVLSVMSPPPSARRKRARLDEVKQREDMFWEFWEKILLSYFSKKILKIKAH